MSRLLNKKNNPLSNKSTFSSRQTTFEKSNRIEEIIFIVEESLEGGFTAKGLGTSIYTQADSIEQLRTAVVDAVRCHYDDEQKRLIRLHIVKEEVIAV